MYKTTRNGATNNRKHLNKEAKKIVSLPDCGLRYEPDTNIKDLLTMIIQKANLDNIDTIHLENGTFEMSFESEFTYKTIRAKRFTPNEWVFFMSSYAEDADDLLPF